MKKIWITILVCGVIIGCAACGKTSTESGEMSGTSSNQESSANRELAADEVIVPNLVGEDLADAVITLADVGLDADLQDEYSELFDHNIVLRQSVSAGSILHRGDSITIYYSNPLLGKEWVPYLVGKSEEEAKKKLKDNGFECLVEYINSDTVEAGIVVSQSIDVGEMASIGDTIAIQVSLGAEGSGEQIPPKTTDTPTETPIATPKPTAAPTAKPTAAPTAKPTAAPTAKPTDKPVVKNWSDWVEALPGGVTADRYDIETRTQYSYRDAETTTSSSKSLDGWTYVKRTESAGSWQVTRDVVNVSENEKGRVEVETQTAYDTVDATKYDYYHYVINGYKGLNWTYSENYYNGAASAGYNPYIQTRSESTYREDRNDSGHVGFTEDGVGWWYSGSHTESSQVPYTEYKYRTVTYTYHFQKWGGFSGWSDTPVSGSSTREVQTRTLYRYKEK